MKSALARRATAAGKPDVRPLLVLLRAPSEGEIVRLFEGVFAHRRDPRPLPSERASELVKTLRCDEAEVRGLLESARTVVWQLVEAPSRPADGACMREEAAALFDDTFHDDLQEVLVRLLAESTPRWRKELETSSPSSRAGKEPSGGGQPSSGVSSAPRWRPLEAEAPPTAVGHGTHAPGDAKAKATPAPQAKDAKKAPGGASGKATRGKAASTLAASAGSGIAARGSGGSRVAGDKGDKGARSSGDKGARSSGEGVRSPGAGGGTRQPHNLSPLSGAAAAAAPICSTAAVGDAQQPVGSVDRIGHGLRLAGLVDLTGHESGPGRGGDAGEDESAAQYADEGGNWDDDDFEMPVMPEADEDSDG